MTLTRKLTAIITSALTAVCLMMPQAADAARRVPPVRGGQANSTVAAAPDFAMPRQVEKNALKTLDIALREGRDPQAVRALADWALAQAAVSADSATVVIDRLHSVCGQVESPVAKAMILALEARVYTNLFRADQWTYTERPTVEGVGEDFTRWSAGQFAQRVDSLVMQSLRPADELRQTGISAYDKVIDIDRAGQVFYPTLYDFVAYQGIECLSAFDRDGRILNERLVDDPDNASLYPAAKPLMRHILEIYSSLAAFHRDRAAALVAVNLARYNYIGDHVYDTDDSVGEALDRRYLALYHGQVGTTPQAVRYLLAANDVDNTTMYGLLTEFEKSHPDYDDINAVKNSLASLSAKSVSASYRQAVAPGVPFPVVVRAGNVAHATVSLYDITSMKFAGNDPTQVKYANVKALLKSPVATRRFDYAGKAVPFAAADTIEFTCAGPGRFIIVAEGDGCSLNGDYLPVIASSALTLASAGDDSNRLGVVVDPVSGAPQAGVSVSFRPWSRRGGETAMPGQTDSKGELKLTTTEGGSFQPRRGDDIYARWSSASNWYDYSEKNTIYSAELQTSLGLYHPGDTVAYAVVVTRHTPRGRSLAAGETVKVMLRDANYQEVATQTLTTDSWGRQQGTVALPAAGLQGRFVLEVYAGDKPDNAIGSTRFMVSDYRLPTFQVSDLRVLPPATPADSAVV
ncbi:MAG: hypothetical protein K2O10_07940, partial [Muribaculaceae bacterium]|nr:hypothetical protein [Muribaculaceae bacterium]